ncbi:MAG: trigger factor [Gammaproteobacteria bacterium]|jgi:trigger factor|nr:trigger factor [Gammaproteobacteria bacterium]
MEVLVENTSTLGRRLKVSVPDVTVTEQIKLKMAKLAREAHIKGFRPGKVPTSVLEKKFGNSVRMEVINELIRQTLGDAVKDKQLQPAGMPKIEEINNESGKNLEFVATFEVYPEITLQDFSEVEIEKRLVEITDQDVLSMIDKLQDQLANWLPVERAVQSGDRLTVDFARLLKDEGASREEQKNVQMIIGTEGVLPGLSEALIGKKKDETVEVSLTYPENWADAPVAGKAVTLWISIHDIAEKQNLSQDELAKKLGLEDADSSKLKDMVRSRMQEELDKALQDEIKEEVLEKLLEKNPIELPHALIEQEKEAIYREMTRNKRGKVSKDILNAPGVEDSARRRVELGLLLNEVIKKHNLKADGQRVRAEVEKIASKFAKPSEIVEAYYGSNDLLYSVERLVLLEQAVDAILGEAKVKEVKASFDDVMNPQDEKGMA